MALGDAVDDERAAVVPKVRDESMQQQSLDSRDVDPADEDDHREIESGIREKELAQHWSAVDMNDFANIVRDFVSQLMMMTANVAVAVWRPSSECKTSDCRLAATVWSKEQQARRDERMTKTRRRSQDEAVCG